MPNQRINLEEKRFRFTDHWRPKTVGELNSHDLMIVQVKGEFQLAQERRPGFLSGVERKVTIQMRKGNVTRGPGEIFVVPKGVEHCPIAENEVHMLLLGPTGTEY